MVGRVLTVVDDVGGGGAVVGAVVPAAVVEPVAGALDIANSRRIGGQQAKHR